MLNQRVEEVGLTLKMVTDLLDAHTGNCANLDATLASHNKKRNQAARELIENSSLYKVNFLRYVFVKNLFARRLRNCRNSPVGNLMYYEI